MNPTLTDIIRDGLWHNNPGLVQLLGLCPLLAISSTMVNAIGLGLATTLTLLLSNTAVSLIRNHTRPEIRIPVYVLIIACIVTAIELVMNAWFHGLFMILGIFIALITTNCAIIGRAEAFAARNSVPRAALDGLMMGLGFTGVLIALGALREALGQGTLMGNAHLLFGEWGHHLTVQIYPSEHGFLLALLPPGAFMAMGLLIAAKNWINSRFETEPAPTHDPAAVDAEVESNLSPTGGRS